MRQDKELLGDWSVYPGHPVTIAFLIIHKYPSLYEALYRKNSDSDCAALKDCDIPGSGNAVYLALDLLKELKNTPSLEETIQTHSRRWVENRKSGDHPQAALPGQAQADKIIPLFQSMVKEWLLKP